MCFINTFREGVKEIGLIQVFVQCPVWSLKFLRRMCCLLPGIISLQVFSVPSQFISELQDVFWFFINLNLHLLLLLLLLQHFIIIIIIFFLATGLFCLVFLMNQRWSPPLGLQVSDRSTFHILCMMFQVQLSVLVKLLNVSLVWLPYVSVNLLLLFRRRQLLPV
jgi:hypothetical protein